MPFPADDAYWQTTADYILSRWGSQVQLVGPNEFMDLFPKNYPYRLLHRLPLGSLDALVVHKGMIDELDQNCLDAYLARWKPVFANTVFVVLAPRHRFSFFSKKVPPKHVVSLTKAIENYRRQPPVRPARRSSTVILVTTYNRPEALQRSLPTLVALNAPILVVNDGSDAIWETAYAAIQKEFPIQMMNLPLNRGLPHALNCGLSHWLADPDVEWISYFQDDVEARPDTLTMLARFQDAAAQPILSGRFSSAHQVIKRETRDGIELIYQRMCPGIHLHAHRRYWEGVMPIPTPYLGAPKKDSPRPGQGADEDWWITCWAPQSIGKNGGAVCVVPGLVRTFSAAASQSSWNNDGVNDDALEQAINNSPTNSPHWWPTLARYFDQKIESEIHPHVPAERADRYHSIDAGSTELEVLQFLAALVCLFKPSVVLETGSYQGFGSLTLASALETNGHGTLVSVECDAQCVAQCRRQVTEFDPRLLSRIHFVTDFSQNFLEQYQGPPFDLCFLDSLLDLRMKEFHILRRRNLLSPGGIVVLHDTSPLRAEDCPGGGSQTYFGREEWGQMREEFDVFEFPYSRGFVLLRHRA
jgi:predicted O-methyltransferase YrrM